MPNTEGGRTKVSNEYENDDGDDDDDDDDDDEDDNMSFTKL